MFNVNLELDKYKSIIPEMPSFSEIINHDKDDEDSVWVRDVPDIINLNYIEREKERLRTGVWIKIKDTPLWIPPNYYHFLHNGIAGSLPPDFRLKELKNTYFKLWVRNNPYANGTFDIKNRKDGRTTRVMSDILFDAMDGQNTHGQFNIQSKTNEDAKSPCWMFLKSQWLNYPEWLKKVFYSDFASQNAMEEKMIFSRVKSIATDNRGNKVDVPSRMLQLKFYPAVFNAQDGSSDVLKCVADEFCKWIVCNPTAFLTNTKQFIRVGATRKGLYEIFSSPADVNHKYVDDVFQVWKDSDSNELDKFGSTKSGLFRYHSNPLDGIEGYYDKFGDSDPNKIYEWIMHQRSNARKEDLMAEVRANPLSDEEMFSSADSNAYWDNTKGLVQRKQFLVTTIYKDEETLEPKYIWGNLEWENGLIDTNIIFRPNEENEFNIKTGRFCFSTLPDFNNSLKDIFTPPDYIESCAGVDPYHIGKGVRVGKGSNAGVVVYKFRDLTDEHFSPRPTAIYNCRPQNIHTFFEDMVMLCVFTRSKLQYERTSDEIERYFDERGYSKWVLDIKGKKGMVQRGKAGGAFITHVMSIVNVITNMPSDATKEYLLANYWFEDLVEQIIQFNRDNTTKFDLFMGFGQAVFGAAYISKKNSVVANSLAGKAFSYLMS